jgi:CSLREA domain-containing protein
MLLRTRATVFGLALWMVPAAGPAAVFTVTSTADLADTAVGNGVCAASGGACTLRAAVQEANVASGADTIQVPAGTFVLTGASGEDLAASGDLDVTKSLTIEGAGQGVTILDGNDGDRILHVASFTAMDFTLRDVTLTRGLVTADPGGALRISTPGPALVERVTITDSHVLGSTSAAIGGAITSIGGALTVRECTLEGNSADSGGALFENGNLLVEDSTIAGNIARAGSFAILYGSTTVRRSTIVGNEATGNMTIWADAGTHLIENSTFSGNIDPAALLHALDSTMTVRNTTVTENDVPTAILASVDSTITMQGSIFHDPLANSECSTSGNGVKTSLGTNIDRDGSCATESNDLPSQDPLLGALTYHGGPTDTHLPAAGSPAIDTGDDAACPATDQRGAARPSDGDGDTFAHCDIGAVEVPEPSAGGVGLVALCALAAVRQGVARRCWRRASPQRRRPLPCRAALVQQREQARDGGE